MTYLITIGCIALYLGYFFYTKQKNAQRAAVVSRTDFKTEFTKAEAYRKQFLDSDGLFLKDVMKQERIDAVNYANIEYSVADSLKDGMKNKLKGMATLGTVRFRSVHTPKYLILSNETLHLFDTDTDGEIDAHLTFSPHHLRESHLEEYPLKGQEQAQAEARGNNVRAYKLSLQTDESPVELIIYSCLIFTNIPELPGSPEETVRDIVVANDFLKQLGDLYPNLKVSLPIL
ncbi:hypothetical protein [uncultured Bacteroides sp.]|uniref:hypothetical protein n=1 Tax=uncultured Bacteroides sp. TaxID=162156 RepID=UPI0025CDF05D|nr:hypothetical protein [uncultured Bacteroides sp.]